jgi:hypothetical protein
MCLEAFELLDYCVAIAQGVVMYNERKSAGDSNGATEPSSDPMIESDVEDGDDSRATGNAR